MKTNLARYAVLSIILSMAITPIFSNSQILDNAFAQSNAGEEAREAAEEAERAAREAAEEAERAAREAAEEAERAAREAAAEAEEAAREAAEEAEKEAREAAEETEREIVTSTTIQRHELKADVGEGVAEVEVTLEFVTPNTDFDQVAQEAVDLFSLDRQTVDNELVITFSDDELGTESGLVTDKHVNAHVDSDGRSSEVEVELRFTIESTDPEVIKEAIVEETQLDLLLVGSMIEMPSLREFGPDAEKIAEIREKMQQRGLAIAEKMQQRGLVIASDVSQVGPEMGQEMAEQGRSIGSEMRQMGLDTAQSMAMTGINIGETMSEREAIAEVKSEVVIEELEQRIQLLEERIQSLLERLDQGTYHLPENVREDSQKSSFNASFEGQTDEGSVVGSVFLENVATRDNVAKFKVTGGEILVGDSVAYDVVFGKARIVKGPAGDILMIIAQIIDSEENVSTIRLAMEAGELKDNIAKGPADFSLGPQSKISNKLIVGGTGQIAEV